MILLVAPSVGYSGEWRTVWVVERMSSVALLVHGPSLSLVCFLAPFTTTQKKWPTRHNAMLCKVLTSQARSRHLTKSSTLPGNGEEEY